MSRLVLTACLALMATGAQAERYINIGTDRVRLLSCFQEVTVPAKYSVTKVLVEPARQAYVKRGNGRVDLVEYPAVYREDRKLVEPSHTVMKPIACD